MVAEELRGHNQSRQYAARLGYRSALTGKSEQLRLEIALREPVLLGVAKTNAKTALCLPMTEREAVAAVPVCVLHPLEVYAEKVRAALTRQPEPAIRDFFDIVVGIDGGLYDHRDDDFARLVERKLQVQGQVHDLSAERLERLRAQRETQLRPVLRTRDFEAFSLDRAIAIIREICELLRL